MTLDALPPMGARLTGIPFPLPALHPMAAEEAAEGAAEGGCDFELELVTRAFGGGELGCRSPS